MSGRKRGGTDEILCGRQRQSRKPSYKAKAEMARDAVQEVGGGHSSDEGKDNRTCRSEGPASFYGRKDRVTAQKAQRTPKEKVRVLQRKLYRAAKVQPQRTFGVLYDKVCNLEVLMVAWEQVRRNRGLSRLRVTVNEDKTRIVPASTGSTSSACTSVSSRHHVAGSSATAGPRAARCNAFGIKSER
jgi:hypothetical protein